MTILLRSCTSPHPLSRNAKHCAEKTLTFLLEQKIDMILLCHFWMNVKHLYHNQKTIVSISIYM